MVKRKSKEDAVHKAMSLGIAYGKLKKTHTVLSSIRGGIGLSRTQLNRRQKSVLNELCDQIPLPCLEGEPFKYPIPRLGALFSKYCEAPAFLELLQRTHALHPSTQERPWRIIVNQDEFTPGAVLRPDNQRKTLHFYISVLEFGSRCSMVAMIG